ncbi:MAG: glycosyltransferase [archaeon]|nr:glycosyltransferase [archaeon]MDA1167460.1 glycosyltransferase [archaeon]
MGEGQGSNVPVICREDGTPYSTAVLIPTINNADELDIVLERLSKQTYPHFDIVISDSKSRDHTKDVCEKWKAIWIDDPSRNRADACNFALQQIDYDLILFTDDDTIPPLDWVEKLVRWFSDPNVGAVGGPNFAPDEDSFGSKCADVAFCTRFMTAGTRYGAQPKGELVPITHNPGVNCAHRMKNLREVNFFEEGCIGAEDVVLDAKIQRAGHKIFIDPSNVMPHRRRKPFKPYMKQMRNYGYTRMVANKRWPEIATWSHTAIGFFPWVTIVGILMLLFGAINGGADSSHWFTLSGEWDIFRAMFHGTLGLISFYIVLAWLGAAIGTSPHRSIATVFLAPLFVFLAHWAYGQGVNKAWKEIRRTGGRAGEGAQIDDRIRTA